MKHIHVSEFRARAPWWGAHLQTLRNRIIRPDISIPGRHQQLVFPSNDNSGDRLVATLHTPESEPTGPLVVLIHGLAGSQNSDYVCLSASYHLRRGSRVLRLNLRGAGPSNETCAGQYHGGCAADIRDAVSLLNPHLVAKGLFLVGFSFGSNILIHLLAHYAEELPILGAITVSAPIDPAQAVKRIMEPGNTLYHNWLLRQMKQQCLRSGAYLSSCERKVLCHAQSLYEFDDRFVAPRNGYQNADEYYDRTRSSPAVPDIRAPLVLIHALDDPWIPPEPYLALDKMDLPHVKIVLTKGGGHVGFHAKGLDETWHDHYAGSFLDSLT